jgi:hypothetical protein
LQQDSKLANHQPRNVDSEASVDDHFGLDAATRTRIAPQFDCDALERLLQHLEAEARPIMLDFFLLPQFGSAAAEPNTWLTLMGSTDPVLNQLLAEVWQPFWDAQPQEMLDDPDSPYPGRELARRRRPRPAE